MKALRWSRVSPDTWGGEFDRQTLVYAVRREDGKWDCQWICPDGINSIIVGPYENFGDLHAYVMEAVHKTRGE